MNSQNIQLIFTAITRFGTILFIIYMVSVLLNVFRYLMRLAAYYEARAHAVAIALETGELDADNYSKYVKALNGEAIEFGKEPLTPLENATGIIGAVGDVVKKAKE